MVSIFELISFLSVSMMQEFSFISKPLVAFSKVRVYSKHYAYAVKLVFGN